ncbi:MAG: dihydroorotate dehydrogenase, partial [Bacteroidota bacterium]
MKKKNSLAIVLTALFVTLGCLFADRAGYTQSEVRVVGLLVFAACFWILEPIPIFATSILIILFEALLISTQSLRFVRVTDDSKLLSYQEIFATFASPIIILFFGGFFL